MFIRFLLSAIMMSTFSQICFADIKLKVQGVRDTQTEARILTAAHAQFDFDQFREVRIQLASDHALLYLFSKRFHRFDLAFVRLNGLNEVVEIISDYHPGESDRFPQFVPKCPDDSTEFIAFAPNDDDIEQQATLDVANKAISKGLKTVLLVKEEATRESYLNYMSCPSLKGNFYDGDSNPDAFVTADDLIYAYEMRDLLNSAFRFKVTNIWLACQAFNDPMLSSVVDGAQAQKFAAGINDLLVGPSDLAAACAMKAAIAGQPMTAAFQECYRQFDNSVDHWGFTGKGSDLFGQ